MCNDLGDMRSKNAHKSKIKMSEVENSGQNSGLRRRNVAKHEEEKESEEIENMKKHPENIKTSVLKPGTYWLTRIVLLRAIGFVYSE